MPNNHFANKKSSHIRFGAKSLIVTTIAIPVLIFFGIVSDFYTAFQMMILEIICFILLMRNRIKVTRLGIIYHKEIFLWEEIKTIGITVTKENHSHLFFYKFIYISKKKHEKPVNLWHRMSYDWKVISEENENVEIIDCVNGVPEYILTASFNRRLIRHIMEYWDHGIISLDRTPGWNCYVRWYNFIHRQKRC